MRSRQSLLCILAAVVVVITAAGSNAIELVGRATMVQTDSIPMGLPGDTVWDFSGVRPLPGSKTWVASKMGDSVLAVACGDSQLTYLERNDSLYWLGFENPSTEMRETGTVRAARPERHCRRRAAAQVHRQGARPRGRPRPLRLRRPPAGPRPGPHHHPRPDGREILQHQPLRLVRQQPHPQCRPHGKFPFRKYGYRKL